MDRPVTDEKLVEGFLQGEQKMFAELVRRYERPLYAFIHRMIGNETDAADLFQDTFLRVFRHARNFDHRSAFKTWLYAIAANRCRSYLAKPNPLVINNPPPHKESHSHEPGPPAAAHAREFCERVRQIVARLPLQQREVFILKAYDDLTYSEIARTLGRPIGTVKSQMRYSLKKLRPCLSRFAE